MAASQIKNVQGMKLATLGTASTPVSMTTHVAPMLPVLWKTTELNAGALLVLQEIHLGAVFRVSCNQSNFGNNKSITFSPFEFPQLKLENVNMTMSVQMTKLA